MRLNPVRRIDRYVIREMVGPIALGVLLWTFLILMNALFVLAREAISNHWGWELTFRLLSLQIPKALELTIPMGVLFGCLLGVGRISADHEWVAIQSAGHGTRVLLRPLALLGIVAMVISGLIASELSPRATFASRQIRREAFLATNMIANLKPRTFHSLESTVLFVDDIPAGDAEGRLEGVVAHIGRTPENPHPSIVLAESGKLYRVGAHHGLVLELSDAVTHQYDVADPESYDTSRSETLRHAVPAPAYFKTLSESPNVGIYDLGLRDLYREIAAADAEENPLIRAIRKRNAETEFHRRLALPAACVIFALLAAPLGLRRARSGKGAGFALSVLVILAYWVTFLIARSLATGREPAIRAWLGMWAANLVLIPWLLAGIARLRQPGGEDRGMVPWLVDRFWAVARWFQRFTPARVEASELEREAQLAPDRVPRRRAGGSSRFVGRIDTYIARGYVKATLFTLVVCYILYIVVELRQLMGDVLSNDLPVAILFEYFKYYLPGMLQFALPVSCMVGAIVMLGALHRTGEVTAIKASGISARRMTVPILLVTAVLCAIQFGVEDRISSVTNRKRHEIKDTIQNRAPRTYGGQSGWVFGARGDTLYHYGEFRDDPPTFRKFSMFRLDRVRREIREHLEASTATWDSKLQRWNLTDVWTRSFPAGSPRNGTTLARSPREVATDLDPPEHFVTTSEVLTGGERRDAQMSTAEMREEIARLEESGYDTTRLVVSLMARYAKAFAPFVMVLLGLPFAFRVGRRGSLYGIGVGIGLVIVYWASLAAFQALGLEAILPPVLAAWAPNIVYGLAGTYLLLYVRT